MFFRQLLNDDTACASYLFGCATHGQFAVVDPHVDLVDEYVALAEAQGVPIVAVLETHVQADHVSGLPELVERTGATAYLPAGAGVDFDHHPLADGEVVASATRRSGDRDARPRARPPRLRGHRPPARRRAVAGADRRRAAGRRRRTARPARPRRAQRRGVARTLYRSLTERLLTLPDHLALFPAHYSGSVCGRGLSANPLSTIGFERRHNRALRFDSEDAFVEALLQDIPPAPERAGGDRRRQPLRPPARAERVTERGAARAAREPRAVLPAGRGQRVRRRDGRPRALDPAAGRPRGLRPHLECRRPRVHRRLRARQGVHQPRRRRPRRARRAGGDS